MLGFSSRANRRNCCTARCWSIWYRLFIATLSFFLAEKLPSVIMTGVESRYFLRTNGHPPQLTCCRLTEVIYRICDSLLDSIVGSVLLRIVWPAVLPRTPA